MALVPVTRPGHGLASTPEGDLAPYDATFSPQAAALDLVSHGSTSSLVYLTYEPASPTRRLHPGLPGVLVVGEAAHRPGRLRDATVQLLSEELLHNRPGSRTAICRLVDVLVVHTVRVWMAEDLPSGTQGDSVAPIDEAVAVALDRIHTEPAHPWTVGALATETGLSRAAFVRHFTAVVGEPLLSYLTSWRLATAARRLRDSSEPLATIARSVGYSSEYTFSRAFKRAYGQPPGRYRTDMRRRAKDWSRSAMGAADVVP